MISDIFYIVPQQTPFVKPFVIPFFKFELLRLSPFAVISVIGRSLCQTHSGEAEYFCRLSRRNLFFQQKFPVLRIPRISLWSRRRIETIGLHYQVPETIFRGLRIDENYVIMI